MGENNKLVYFYSGQKMPTENIKENGLYFINDSGKGKLQKGNTLIAETNEVSREDYENLDKKIFVGTTAKYKDALKNGDIVDGTVVHLTDDNGSVGGGTGGSGSGSGSGSTGSGSGSSSSSRVEYGSTLPLASNANRGRFFILEKDSNNDSLYICIKRDGSYQWFDITTGTTGRPGEESASTKAILGTGKLGELVLGRE